MGEGRAGGAPVNLFLEAIAWLTDPAQWSGGNGIPIRLAQHLAITVVVVVAASAISLPVGVLIGHHRRGAAFIGAITGGARAIPTLGLLTLFALWLGIGLAAPVLALIVLAIPSILAGAYSGITALDPSISASATAIGMRRRQVMLGVEVPLAAPVIIGGIRAATLQVVATATLAAYVADAGLGRYLFTGLKSRDYAQMLGGALLVAGLALAFEIVLAIVQRQAALRISRTAGSQPVHS